MTEQEKKQKMYQIYAVLGELGILKKQKSQELAQIDAEIAKYENELITVSQTPTEAEDQDLPEQREEWKGKEPKEAEKE